MSRTLAPVSTGRRPSSEASVTESSVQMSPERASAYGEYGWVANEPLTA